MILHAQKVSFTMNFEDAKGNTDSLIIGYDPNATDTVDTAFGETNLYGNPWDPIFEVRLSGRRFFQSPFNTGDNLHLKKQIFSVPCDRGDLSRGVLIKAKYWPVKVRWNKALFQDTCLMQSYFGSVYFDIDVFVGGIRNLRFRLMKDSSYFVFTPNYNVGGNPFIYTGFINEKGDTISNFWLYLSNHLYTPISSLISTNQFIIYPNPVTNVLHVSFISNSNLKIKTISILDINGKEIIKTSSPQIDVRNLIKGIYIIKIATPSNQAGIAKFIKL